MIQKIKNISIIALIILILCSIAFIFCYRIYKNKKIQELNSKQKILNDKQIELNKELEELKKIKSKTVKEFIYLKDNKKIKEYEKVLKQKDDVIKLAEKYKDQSEKYKKQYEEAIKLASNEIKWGIDLLAFGGINSEFCPEIYAGATINKYFNLKLLTLGLGIGGYTKIMTIRNNNSIMFDGGGIILQIKFLF